MDEEWYEFFAGRPIWRFGGEASVRLFADEPVTWAVALDLFPEFLDTVPIESLDALVVADWGQPWESGPPIDLLCALAPRLTSLRALYVGWSYVAYHQNPTDVGRLLAAYPELETLRLLGLPDPGHWREPLRHASLRRLEIETAALPGQVARALGESDLPALEHLELWIGLRRYGADTTVDDLAPILSGQRLPRLRHLGLCTAEDADAVAAAVAAAPIVARLESLDLSQGTLGDAGAEALLRGQSLAHLRALNLSHHFLSEPTQAHLTDALPGIVNLDDPMVKYFDPHDCLEDGRYTVMREIELAYMPVEE